IEDLKKIQGQVNKVLPKAIAATVGLRVGAAQGSGVIVSKDGYVLTAGHVSGKNDRDVTVILADGKRVKGKTLGANNGIDSGMIKITDPGEWPFVDMGDSKSVKKGGWCLTIGHPGGVQPGRTPVVRLGRVIENSERVIRTDCSLVGGDSGGPLFDMEGKVIGIHSRIGPFMTTNYHVPVGTYVDTWDKLVKGEVWSDRPGRRPIPTDAGYLGVEADPASDDCKIFKVRPESPAAKAGLKEKDLVTEIDGQKVTSFDDLATRIQKKKAGDSVTLLVKREDKVLTLKVVLGKRPTPTP